MCVHAPNGPWAAGVLKNEAEQLVGQVAYAGAAATAAGRLAAATGTLRLGAGSSCWLHACCNTRRRLGLQPVPQPKGWAASGSRVFVQGSCTVPSDLIGGSWAFAARAGHSLAQGAPSAGGRSTAAVLASWQQLINQEDGIYWLRLRTAPPAETARGAACISLTHPTLLELMHAVLVVAGGGMVFPALHCCGCTSICL